MRKDIDKPNERNVEHDGVWDNVKKYTRMQNDATIYLDVALPLN